MIVEPIQGRGGERVPTDGFLSGLRAICDEAGWLLIADEIYTGLGRTGDVFACDHEGVVPDLLCVGKGLASGMPLSACLGRASVFEAWPRSEGEALHTQTFLGHPASCAAASPRSRSPSGSICLPRGGARRGDSRPTAPGARRRRDAVVEVRGRGLMIGIECARPEIALDGDDPAARARLRALPSGDGGRVLS